MGRDRRRQKLGCFELVFAAFVLFVVLQLGMLGVRLVTQLARLAATLLQWIAFGAVGALAIAVVIGVLYGLGKGVAGLARALAGAGRKRSQAEDKHVSHLRQARQWRGGIKATVRRLRRRGWLSKDDAKRYCDIANTAVKRVKALEGDLHTMHSLPATEKWATRIDAAAVLIVERLERTHLALVQLLAESAIQPDSGIEADLREAADEMESLIAALADVRSAGPVSTATGEPLTSKASTVDELQV